MRTRRRRRRDEEGKSRRRRRRRRRRERGNVGRVSVLKTPPRLSSSLRLSMDAWKMVSTSFFSSSSHRSILCSDSTTQQGH